jgi:hypothetical protein
MCAEGKLYPATYDGDGYPLCFFNPDSEMKELKKIHEKDFERVMKEIGKKTGLEIEGMTKTPDGIRQFKTGKKGSGTVQLYLSSSDRLSGNIRVQIGVNGISRVKILRKALLQSEWFSDTDDKETRMSEQKGRARHPRRNHIPSSLDLDGH